MGSINLKKHNVTFIHIPKTAGQSIRAWLMEFPDANIMSLKDRHINGKHPDFKTTKDAFGDLGWTFCAVRNPYDRAVSMWSHLKRVDKSFPGYGFKKFVFEYADYETFMKPISTWFDGGDIDYVMKFENLANDFKVIQERLGSQKKLIKKNVSSHNAYQDYYDDDTRDFVTNKFKNDLERFNYSFE